MAVLSKTGWRQNGRYPIKVYSRMLKSYPVRVFPRVIATKAFLQKSRININGEVRHDR